jgi:beta-1,4-mannosyl-glycoprotein beta-1,4-N-acetylglucosaminyltransferase
LKTYDCVPFFNEFDQLRLRIALLEDLVDRFVVIEAHQTHTGKPKPLYLAESGAADLLRHPKVVVRAVDLPVGYSDWEREQHQRESIGGVLREIGARPEDLVLVSDVDEIPERAALLRARDWLPQRAGRTLLIFEQRMFYFRLNFELVWSRKLPWLGTAAALYGQAPSINGLRTTGRNIRGRHSQGFDRGAQVFQLPEGGWHFSYLGGDEAFDRKLAAYAHQERSVQARRGTSVQAVIDGRQSLFPRRGVDEVWAVVERAAVGLPDAAVARASVGQLFESPHDSTHAILRRVREVTLAPRLRLGGLRLGYAGRSQWPRLPLTAGRGTDGA